LAGTKRTQSGHEVAVLPRSTASDLLNGSSLPRLPRLTFVEAFVTACARVVGNPPEVIESYVQRWRVAWRTLAEPGDHAGTALPVEQASWPSAPDLAVPRELPADIGYFTARDDEVGRLYDHFANYGERRGLVTSGAIDGPCGIGKSALAIHVAHKLAPHFPDGQLYVDLRGTTDGDEPLAPGEVLDRWLRVLSGGAMNHAGLQEAAALFRSLVGGRRMLVVLDNAQDAGQVRALLPASSACGVLITSRRVLSTVDCGIRVSLDLISEPDSMTLLQRLIGPARVLAEPVEALAIVRLCGYLPLAIRAAGARLAARPHWSLAKFAALLTDERGRLDELQVAELSVRPRIAASYQDIGTGLAGRHARRIFERYGVSGGRNVDVVSAAALTGLSVDAAGAALDRLVDAQLLRPANRGRYVMHELTRLYAGELAILGLPEMSRRHVLERLLRWYIGAAEQATMLLEPAEDRRIQTGWQQGELVDAGLRTPTQAVAWAEAERVNLVELTRRAADGPEEIRALALRLIFALYRPFANRGHTAHRLTLNKLAVDLARSLHDPHSEALALEDLGSICADVGRTADAVKYNLKALKKWRSIGDRVGEVGALTGLSIAYRQRGSVDSAITCAQRALPISREIAYRSGEASSLNHLGLAYQHLGRFDDAARCAKDSSVKYRGIDSHRGEAIASANLAWALQRRGETKRAFTYHRSSLTLFRDLGDRYNEAEQLWGLGWLHHAVDQRGRAFDSLGESLAILEDIGTLRRDEENVTDLQVFPDMPEIIRANT
jgi:tetratricopeptide (TPR) repeat protein